MGPYATQILANLGADVIKVEPPFGDVTRRIGPGHSHDLGSNFLHMSRNKRSIVLDLKKGGREVLLRLAEDADVFIHNVREAAMERLELGYEDLRRVNDRIIYCSLTGFGEGGEYSGLPAYDDLIQGLCAIPTLNSQGGQPKYVPLPLADRSCGLHASIAVLAALNWRAETGEGQKIQIPMFETVAHMVLSDHLFGQSFEPPLGPAGYNRQLSPNKKPYRTKDGWICILPYTDQHWTSLLPLLGRSDLLSDPRVLDMRQRNQMIDELYAVMEEALLARGTNEWIELLSAHNIPVGRLHDLASLIEDPHLASVGFFEKVTHPTEGPIRTMRLPYQWSRTQPEIRNEAPHIGEHGREVLRDAGYSEEEIEELVSAGATISYSPPRT